MDHVLALYLIDVSEHVIVNFFKATAVFVTLFRRCINDLAWYKIANYKLMLDFDSTDADSEENAPFSKRPPVFTSYKSGCIDQHNQSGCDMIYTLANEFCSDYLQRRCNTFDKKLAIDLT